MSNIPKLRFKEFSGEWKESFLGDLASIKTGSKDTQDKTENGKYPFFVRSQTIEKIDTYSFDGEAILTAGDGVGVGKVFHYLNEKFDYHQRVYNIHKFNDGVLGKYIYYYFSDRFYKRVIRLSAKNSVDSVRMEMISKMLVPLPILSEQQKIASFLTSVDKKIELLTQKEKLLKDYKKGIMQKIFSQEIRFKADDGSEFPEWVEKRLGDICYKSSSNLSANSLGDSKGEYPIYGATGYLQNIETYQETQDYISIVKDGAGVGRVLLCKAKSSVLGTLDKILVDKQKNNLFFTYLLLLNLDFKKYVIGSTIPHIYFKDYSKEKVEIPCLEEQNKIANFLSAIDSKIEQVTKQLEHTKEFKKGLLQQMFV